MLIILGALVTGLTQWLKKESPNEYWTILIAASLSIAAAGVYTALVAAGFWQTTLQILTISGAIYTFIIARFEGKEDDADQSESASPLG